MSTLDEIMDDIWWESGAADGHMDLVLKRNKATVENPDCWITLDGRVVHPSEMAPDHMCNVIRMRRRQDPIFAAIMQRALKEGLMERAFFEGPEELPYER